MRVLGLVSLALTLLATSACYRLGSPPTLGETVRIEVVGNQGRMPRAQGYFVDATSRALVNRLGWRVSPTGTATLQVVLREERIDAPAQDRRGISTSWSIRIEGTALLVARGGSLTGTFTGAGNATGLNTVQGEPEALKAAATQAADDLVSWLDAHAGEISADARARR